MKTVKQLTPTVVLILVLASSAFAGEIQLPAASPPPSSSAENTSSAEIDTPGEIQIPETQGAVMEAAMGLMQTLLSVF